MQSNSLKPRGSYADYVSGNYSNKKFVFELVKKNPPGSQMFSKETGRVVPFPLSFPLPLIGTVYEKDAQGKLYPRKIRYVPGETSIYVDEQTPDDKNPKRTVRAEFIKGRYEVDGRDSILLKYFMTVDTNETKENRDTKKQAIFRLVDTTKAAAKAQEQFKTEFELLEYCYKADFKTKVYPLAQLILRPEQLVQPSADIRHDLAVLVKTDVDKFKRLLEDPKTERGIVVNAAIEKNIIGVNEHMNALYWVHNPSVPFSQAPIGQKAIPDFIGKSFTKVGEQTYKEILEALEAAEAFDEDKSALLSAQPPAEEELQDYFKRAEAMGLITCNKTKVWWKYKNNKPVSGREGLLKEFRSDNELWNQLKADILPTI